MTYLFVEVPHSNGLFHWMLIAGHYYFTAKV
jgi:hypothetical protein